METRSLKIIWLLLGLILCAQNARPLSLQSGPQGYGAQSMGLAGAAAALQQNVESIYWNPAGLAYLSNWQAGLTGGMDDGGNGLHSAMALAGPVGDYGILGFSLKNSQLNPSPSFRASQASAALALAVTDNFSIGTNQKFLSADPGGLAGWSMDLGLQARLGLPEFLGKELVFGLSASDLASALNWSTGALENQPVLFQMGLRHDWGEGTQVALQLDHNDDWTSQSPLQWRAAAQQDLLSQALALRIGATQITGSSTWLSAGLGWRFKLWTMNASLDYAFLDNLGSADGSIQNRHLLSLDLAWPQHALQGPEAILERLLVDPKSNKILFAKISFPVQSSVETKSWEFDILDERGSAIRKLRGPGALPPFLNWDGRDDQGNIQENKRLWYELKLATAEEHAWVRKAPLSKAADLKQLETEGALYVLDRASEDTESQGPEVALIRVLTEPSSKKLRRVILGMSMMESAQVGDWEMDITDAKGRVLRTLHGSGPLPATVQWDGKDETGQNLSEQPFSYVLRSTTQTGTKILRKAALAPLPSVLPAVYGELSGMDSDTPGLRQGQQGDLGLAPRVRPALKGVDHSQIDGADFDLGELNSRPVSAWELKVVDSQGRVVKTYSGKGNPPKTIHWQGTNDAGEPVDTGLGGSYVLRVVESGGKKTELAQYLVNDKALEQLSVPPSNEAPKPGTETKGFVLWNAGGVWHCRLYFPKKVARLSPQQISQMKALANIIEHEAPAEVHIEGHADGAGEKADNMQLSHDRSDAVLHTLYEVYSIHPDSLSSISFGDQRPVASNETEQGRLLNRRVEVSVRRKAK